MSNPDLNGLNARLKAGNAFGAWCNFASFCSVELMTLLHFDFLILDMQHGELTMSDLPALLAAFGKTATLPIVRAPENNYHSINWLFDQGVPGVLVPMINSVEDAKRAVGGAKFPPVGRRSFGPFRAAQYGTKLGPFIEGADRSATLIVQVEDAGMARNIDALLELQGIDAVFMGPNDLAFSMLNPGESIAADPTQYTAFARTPPVLDLCSHVMERCRAAQMPFGMTAGSMDEARSWLERGASFVTYGSDFMFMRGGAEHLCPKRTENG